MPVQGFQENAVLSASAKEAECAFAECAFHPDESYGGVCASVVLLLPSPCVLDGAGDAGRECLDPVAECLTWSFGCKAADSFAGVGVVEDNSEDFGVFCGRGDGLRCAS